MLAERGQHPGLFQLVQGGSHVGGLLVTDARIRAISFTGGLNGGRAIAAACAEDFKPAQLELGGNNPIVVLDDADVDQRLQRHRRPADPAQRSVVPRARPPRRGGVDPDALLDAVLDKLAEPSRLGDSLSPETEMGPIMHCGAPRPAARPDRRRAVAKGGKAHATTPLPDLPGNFLAPTLVTGIASADAQEEIFGPVATVHVVSATTPRPSRVANGTPFGLEGYVFAGDTERGMDVARQVRAGGVKVNGSTMLSPQPDRAAPGVGTVRTAATRARCETLLFFTNHRVVGVENLSAADLARMAAGG